MLRLKSLTTASVLALTARHTMVIALLMMAGFAVPVHASTMITGTFNGDATLTPTSTPGISIQNFTGDGDDTTYDSFTPTSQSTVDFSSPPNITISDGTFTETFSQGKLFGTSSGSGTADGNGTATFTLDFVFTGGTGLFAGATGDATATATITATGATTELITGSYIGSLTTATPLPAALPLFATGLGALGLLVRGAGSGTTPLLSQPPDQHKDNALSKGCY